MDSDRAPSSSSDLPSYLTETPCDIVSWPTASVKSSFWPNLYNSFLAIHDDTAIRSSGLVCNASLASCFSVADNKGRKITLGSPPFGLGLSPISHMAPLVTDILCVVVCTVQFSQKGTRKTAVRNRADTPSLGNRVYFRRGYWLYYVWKRVFVYPK